MFSTDEAEGRINQNLALFVSNGDNGYAEQPKEAVPRSHFLLAQAALKQGCGDSMKAIKMSTSAHKFNQLINQNQSNERMPFQADDEAQEQ